MPIVASGRPANSAGARFRTPPWSDEHPAAQALAQRLAADHLACIIDQAVARLDLSALRARYGGTGSAAHPPSGCCGPCSTRCAGVAIVPPNGTAMPTSASRSVGCCGGWRWPARAGMLSATVWRRCWTSWTGRYWPKPRPLA